MPVQTAYTAEHAAAFEGQRSNLGLTNITSRVAQGGDIPFGRAVVRGTADNQAKLPTGASQGFLGITEMTTAWAENSSDLHLYPEYREMNIIDFGEIWVYTEQSVVPGDAVYFRHTADTAPLDIVGRFRKDSSGGDAELITGAAFQTTAAAGGIAKVKMDAPGVGVLLAPDSSETLTVAGAASVDTGITYFDSTAGAMAVTLADGTEGQRKTLMMLVDGGDVVVTPANYANDTTITFNDAFDACELLFTGSQWHLVAAIGTIGRGIDAGVVTITTTGAIGLAYNVVFFDTTGGAIAASLADGVAGQRMTMKMLVDGATDVTMTPDNFLDGNDITFDDVGDSCELLFDGTNWGVVGTPTATVA